jgi:hypothetical protein
MQMSKVTESIKLRRKGLAFILIVLVAIGVILIISNKTSLFHGSQDKQTVSKKSAPSPTPLTIKSKDDLGNAVKALDSENVDSLTNNVNQIDRDASNLK